MEVHIQDEAGRGHIRGQANHVDRSAAEPEGESSQDGGDHVREVPFRGSAVQAASHADAVFPRRFDGRGGGQWRRRHPRDVRVRRVRVEPPDASSEHRRSSRDAPPAESPAAARLRAQRHGGLRGGARDEGEAVLRGVQLREGDEAGGRDDGADERVPPARRARGEAGQRALRGDGGAVQAGADGAGVHGAVGDGVRRHPEGGDRPASHRGGCEEA